MLAAGQKPLLRSESGRPDAVKCICGPQPQIPLNSSASVADLKKCARDEDMPPHRRPEQLLFKEPFLFHDLDQTGD